MNGKVVADRNWAIFGMMVAFIAGLAWMNAYLSLEVTHHMSANVKAATFTATVIAVTTVSLILTLCRIIGGAK